MSGEVVELKQDQGSQMPVTQADVDALKRQRDLLREFVSSQMREANFTDSRAEGYGDGDYGVIPGTKKKCLLKPGAEKLLRLFNLGARVRLVDKEVDRMANFAMFTYRAEVYHLRTSAVIAECEGSANSQEVKYKERTVWRKNPKGVKEMIKEETPISDVLNTLMKMAQKRALVGATILATAASDYFSPDLEDGNPLAAQDRTQESKQEKEVQSEVASEEAPICCNKPMMVSKYPNRETKAYDWYCTGCRGSKPRSA